MEARKDQDKQSKDMKNILLTKGSTQASLACNRTTWTGEKCFLLTILYCTI